jgi:hypothetical protein
MLYWLAEWTLTLRTVIRWIIRGPRGKRDHPWRSPLLAMIDYRRRHPIQAAIRGLALRLRPTR